MNLAELIVKIVKASNSMNVYLAAHAPTPSSDPSNPSAGYGSDNKRSLARQQLESTDIATEGCTYTQTVNPIPITIQMALEDDFDLEQGCFRSSKDAKVVFEDEVGLVEKKTQPARGSLKRN
jgi:hypothetical protein